MALCSDLKVVDIFTPFSSLPWSIWLDSCESNHIDSRFDILVFNPLVTLSTFGEITEIKALNEAVKSIVGVNEVNQSYSSSEDPLLLINTLTKSIFGPAVTKHASVPFIGGALGAFSYDLGRRFEKIPSQALKDINVPDMAVGIYHQAIIFDNKTDDFWLVCPESDRAGLEHKIKQTYSNHNNIEQFALTSNWQSNMSKAEYSEKFNVVQQYLLSGDCYQINLAQRFKARYQGNEFNAYKTLREENKAPFSGFIRLENSAILSLSPERFLQSSNGHVQSKPIKGTLPRNSDDDIDKHNAITLQNSTKDRAENLMIVDLLRNDMSKVCVAGSVKVPKLFDIESFPAVHHLVSTVEGTLSHDKNATDLLRGAFPGGSITGAPKIRAMEIIESLEPHRRSIYCGSIGYISCCGTMDSSITIRTLVCENDNKSIYCWAGGGLVADSNVESEYQETFDKVQRILPVLSRSK
ncbi:MAG: aminodeoxychorismate synthase component I [Colwellia sp.]